MAHLRRSPAKASFSVAFYGRGEARRLAIKARRSGLAALLGSFDVDASLMSQH
jgi:hypothetical protein